MKLIFKGVPKIVTLEGIFSNCFQTLGYNLYLSSFIFILGKKYFKSHKKILKDI